MLEGLENHLAWDRIACEQALLFVRAKRAARGRGKAPHFRVLLARLLFTTGDVCTQAIITTAGVIDKRHLTKPSRKQQKTLRSTIKTVLSDYRETNNKWSLSFANSFDNVPAKITQRLLWLLLHVPGEVCLISSQLYRSTRCPVLAPLSLCHATLGERDPLSRRCVTERRGPELD